MLKAIIVDDQLDNRLQLRSLLDEHIPGIQITGEAENVGEAQLLVLHQSPDVLFLDVEMSDGTGFDLLDRIGEYRCLVVFVTAFQQYAVKAFKTNAVDYLLKPVIADELIETCQKLEDWWKIMKRDTGKQVMYRKAVKFAAEQATDSKPAEQLVISSHKGMEIVQTQDIKYIEADNTYSKFHLNDSRQLTASRPILEYEELLNPDSFFRVHRSYIINVQFLELFIPKKATAILKDGSELPVSRRKAPAFTEFLRNMPL